MGVTQTDFLFVCFPLQSLGLGQVIGSYFSYGTNLRRVQIYCDVSDPPQNPVMPHTCK